MIDHGQWEKYIPDEIPFGYSPYTLFWRRASDGEDWYIWTREHFNVQNGADTTGTKKIIVVGNVASQISNDVTGLSGPENFKLYELEEGDVIPQLLWILVGGQFQAP